MILEVSQQIFEIYSNIKFNENSSSERRVRCGRMYRRTDMTKLRVAFRNFADASKNNSGRNKKFVCTRLELKFSWRNDRWDPRYLTIAVTSVNDLYMTYSLREVKLWSPSTTEYLKSFLGLSHWNSEPTARYLPSQDNGPTIQASSWIRFHEPSDRTAQGHEHTSSVLFKCDLLNSAPNK